MRKWLLVVVALGVFLAAQPTLATPTIMGSSLQDALDDITVFPDPGASSVAVTTDFLGDGVDSYWAIGGAGGSISTVIIGVAALSDTNTFGVYDNGFPGTTVELFDGSATTGSQVVLSILGDGSVIRNFTDTGVNFGGNNFGFYLDSSAGVGGGLWYSDTSLNSDNTDHMAAYQGTNTDTIKIGDFAPGVWSPNEYVLAWEDLDNTGGAADKDYSDFVVIVESVNPIPETSAIALWAMIGGVFGMGCWFRRRRQIPS